MLSLFPQILFLSPLALTLLRVALAVYLAYIAWHLLNKHEEIERIQFPIIGNVRAWMVWVSATLTAAIAAIIFIGAWTQVAGILAAIVILKHLVYFRRYQSVFPFPRSTYILLLCIALTLIVSGAGAFAFDLPL